MGAAFFRRSHQETREKTSILQIRCHSLHRGERSHAKYYVSIDVRSGKQPFLEYLLGPSISGTVFLLVYARNWRLHVSTPPRMVLVKGAIMAPAALNHLSEGDFCGCFDAVRAG